MIERCPVCRARLREPPNCQRCGSDLSAPLAIAHQADVCRRRALRALAANDLAQAAQAAGQTLALQRTSFDETLLAWITDLQRNA